jgi:hypothetical protein
VIRLHEFNTKWWGQQAGIIDDAGFFSLPPPARRQALGPFQWAEFKSQLKSAPPLIVLQRAGFFLADTQQEYRIALKADMAGQGSRALQVSFADECPFELRVGDFASFTRERFQHLPGCTDERINHRYAEWARSLIRDHPETCLRVVADGATQGWVLSRPVSNGLNLALAMLHREAKIFGFHLYEKAFAAYAAKGHRIGLSSFSVTNTPVLNICAKLGARFDSPTGIWLWVAE